MSSVDEFADKCADYVREHGGTPEAHGKMTAHIQKSIKDPEKGKRVLEKFNAILQLEDEEPPSEDSELDEDEEEESGEEVDTGVDDGEDVLDLEQFSSKGKFDQDGAEKAFHEWKKKRNDRKRPLNCIADNPDAPPPDIAEDVFAKRRRELTSNLIASDKGKIQKIDAELADPETEMTARERKRLEQMKARLESSVREREAQIA